MNRATAKAVNWTEQGLVPDAVIRHGIRRLLRQRLANIHADDCESSAATLGGFADMMNASPIAPLPALANEQHYDVPADFFSQVLGPRRKYSACYWHESVGRLADAEDEALRLTCLHAEVEDGMSVLDLGCGWGSLSLWIAEHFPHCHVTAVSNSRAQHEFIREVCARRGIGNVETLIRDMNDFTPAGRFDRIVSIEMFEHMRNYRELFERIADWLHDDGRFLMHIFCHRSTPYEFLDEGPGDWMSRHFFAGGIMPSVDLPLYFQQHLEVASHWRWSGTHYARTCNTWLVNLDLHKESVMALFDRVYGRDCKQMWFMRWRMFFMACAELFDYDNGQEWLVAHYLFRKRRQPR